MRNVELRDLGQLANLPPISDAGNFALFPTTIMERMATKRASIQRNRYNEARSRSVENAVIPNAHTSGGVESRDSRTAKRANRIESVSFAAFSRKTRRF
jgi:hypothetical protein